MIVVKPQKLSQGFSIQMIPTQKKKNVEKREKSKNHKKKPNVLKKVISLQKNYIAQPG